MPILIAQTQEEMQDSHAFSRRAEIMGVRVSSAAYSTRSLPGECSESLSAGVRYTPQEIAVSNGRVNASTLFECVVTEAGASEEDSIAKLECSLTASYQLEEGYVPSDAELTAFHNANIIFNCWPYFREFVQSSACRMNVPPPPIPFVRVHVVPNQVAKPLSPANKKRSANKSVNRTSRKS